MIQIACVDLEGVLIPELWPHLARVSGIADLAVTTREEPDYVRLVARRIKTLRANELTLKSVQSMLYDLEPLSGAKAFLDALLLRDIRVVLVSDAFREMVVPLYEALGAPEIRCHRFVVDRSGFINEARYVRQEGKHEVIAEFEAEGLGTLAVGDAFNDLSMIRQATLGYLFQPSEQTLRSASGLRVTRAYAEILAGLDEWTTGDRLSTVGDADRKSNRMRTTMAQVLDTTGL